MAKLWRGVINSNPNDLSIKVDVILPDLDKNLNLVGCRWQARDALSLPTIGDECLVAFDNNNEPWIIGWWPF